MIRFNNSINIAVPVTEVFDFVSNFENIPKWNYYVLNVTKKTPGPVNLGTIYHQERKSDNQDFQIVELNRNHLIVIETIPGSQPYFKRTVFFRQGIKEALIEDIWKLNTRTPQFLEKLILPRIRSAVFQNLTILKDLLENKTAILQNGKKVHI